MTSQAISYDEGKVGGKPIEVRRLIAFRYALLLKGMILVASALAVLAI